MIFDADKLLRDVSDETRFELETNSSPKAFAAGADLLHIDAQTPGAFLIVCGRVRSWRPLIDGRAVTLSILAAGTVVGLVACARNSASAATVTALDAVEADLWPTATLRHLIAADGAFARNLLATVADYSVLMMEKLGDSMAPVETRLARALLRVASEHGDWREDMGCSVAISRQELADLSGTTMFTASRTLSDWERQGLIHSSRGRVALTDPGRLANLADMDR